jgi:phosphate uptake regulator
MKVIERSVQEIGKSLLVTLPKGWADAMKIRKGSNVKMMVSDKGSLTIAPELNVKEDHLQVTLPFDEYFARRFFREYFHGNEKITFLLSKGVSEQERKKLSNLLSKFMNVQVIEETSAKVVIKCFKIEELSVDECMKRMFYLSLNLFDELRSSNDKTKMNEMDDAITRFYYMLVMQIRRYLTEGKYAEQNQISLTRAMDFRMVAEKVERSADIVKASEYFSELDKEWLTVRDYYNRSVLSFLNKEYEKALGLMLEYQALAKKYLSLVDVAAKRKNIKIYRQYKDLLQILQYAREISMLVR